MNNFIMNVVLKIRNIKLLIKLLKIENGTGDRKILLIPNVDIVNNLDTLVHIVWMLYLWLFIRLCLLNLLNKLS